MNKFYALLLGMVLICVSLISAYNIAYVVKYPDNLNSNELFIRDTLINKGYNVDVLDDVSFNINDYGVVVVSERINSIKNIFDNRNIKTFFMSSIAAKNQGLAEDSGGSSGRKVVISDNDNAVTGGFSIGELNVYPSDGKMNYLKKCKAINSKSLVSKSTDSRDILLLLDKDALLLDGGCNKRDKEIYERNLFFGLSEASKWNSDAEKLFINAFNWLVDADDSDGDGYSEIEDCNDNDASIYPGAEELIDSIDQNCINDAPVLVKDIRAIFLNKNENQKNVIDLYEYFKDPDGDSLIFSVDSISNEENIKVSIKNSLVSFDVGELSNNELVVFKANDGESDMLSNEVILSPEDLESCSNLNGFTCSINQVCNGDWLDFSNICCSVACTLEETLNFSDVDRELDKLNENINVNIRKPSDNAEFMPGKEIETKVEIESKVNKKLDFDGEVYLYDLNDEKVIESVRFNVGLKNSEKKVVDNNIKVYGDIDESHNYAILTTVIDENGEYYNEDYVKITFKREKDDVIIEKLELSPDIVSCGDYVNIKARVYNVGESDENVYVRVKNSELEIDEKSDEFLLEKYDNDDTKIVEFKVEIPSSVKNGEYVLRIAVYFGGKSNYIDRVLTLKDCEKQETENEVIDISNTGNISDVSPVKIKKGWFGLQEGMLIWSFVVLVVLVFVMVGFKFRR